MNVYIDCGAYTGDTVNCEKLFNFKADYKIAFEANTDFAPQLQQAGFDEVNMKAVWVNNDRLTFYKDHSEVPMGSTLMDSKTTGDLKPIAVEAIDFAKFLTKFEGSKVLVKMDIEGAEFNVLNHLIATSTDTIIDTLYVETHENKVSEYTGIDKEELLAKLSCKVVLWH